MGFGVVGLQLQGAAICIDGLSEAPVADEDVAEVEMGMHKIWLEAQCFLQVLNGLVMAARLMHDQTEQMQCIDLLRIVLQELTAMMLRVGQPTGLDGLDNRAERLRSGIAAATWGRF